MSETAVAALFTAWVFGPPSEPLSTEPGFAFLATQSRPAMIPDQLPLLSQPSTRTLTSAASRATPYVEPPTVPVTWVPWPLQSLPPRPSPIASKPGTARPPNSACLKSMPVSST